MPLLLQYVIRSWIFSSVHTDYSLLLELHALPLAVHSYAIWHPLITLVNMGGIRLQRAQCSFSRHTIWLKYILYAQLSSLTGDALALSPLPLKWLHVTAGPMHMASHCSLHFCKISMCVLCFSWEGGGGGLCSCEHRHWLHSNNTKHPSNIQQWIHKMVSILTSLPYS